MAQKRVSRARKRDLEQPDEFLTFTSQLFNRIQTNWKPISAGFVLFMAIIAGILVFDYFDEKAENSAFALLSQTMNRYAAEQTLNDSQKALETVSPDFNQLFAKYGKRQGGMAGRLIFAQLNYQAGQAEAARTHYTEAAQLYPEGSYGAAAAWSGLGYAQIATGQDDAAIAAFTKIIDGQAPTLKADAMYQLILLYKKTGKLTEYDQTLKAFKEKYPGNMYTEILPNPSNG